MQHRIFLNENPKPHIHTSYYFSDTSSAILFHVLSILLSENMCDDISQKNWKLNPNKESRNGEK